MDDALQAYDAGRADGSAGRHDTARAGEPGTGADYLVGIVDGQMSSFEENLLTAVREALGGADPALGGANPALGGADPALGGTDPALGGTDPALGGKAGPLGGKAGPLGGKAGTLGGRAWALDGENEPGDDPDEAR